MILLLLLACSSCSPFKETTQEDVEAVRKCSIAIVENELKLKARGSHCQVESTSGWIRCYITTEEDQYRPLRFYAKNSSPEACELSNQL